MVLAIAFGDAVYGLAIALIAAVPGTGAIYIGMKNHQQVEKLRPSVENIERQATEMAPLVRSTEDAVNNKLLPSSPTLRETAEATGIAVDVLKDQEAARVVERDTPVPDE